MIVISNIANEIYRKIPHGRFKSLLKNVISYSMYKIPAPVEIYSLNNVEILLYKDRSISNKQLVSEVRGYVTKRGINKNDTIIDAGAYTGIFSIYAAKKTGIKGKVLAFEPDPYNYLRLKQNIQLNKISNIVLVKKGLYSKIGKMKMDIQGFGSTIMLNQYKNQTALNNIQVTTLDKELTRLKTKRVNFIKMDIEGAEIEAVKGCIKTIHSNKNIFFAIASYHVVENEPTYLNLEKLFRKFLMRVITIKNRHTTTYAYR
jgi:FkbM family methyltransferase